MMDGFLTADREPSLRLEVQGPDGVRSIEAIIDTGFNRGLTLPRDWIDTLGLQRVGEDAIILADGRQTATPVYAGYVVLEETAYETPVTVAPSPLVGTDLLWGFSLYVEFQDDGAVEVESLPSS